MTTMSSPNSTSQKKSPPLNPRKKMKPSTRAENAPRTCCGGSRRSGLSEALRQAWELAEQACDLLHVPYVTDTELADASEAITRCCSLLRRLIERDEE